jgi:hypothetical protein
MAAYEGVDTSRANVDSASKSQSLLHPGTKGVSVSGSGSVIGDSIEHASARIIDNGGGEPDAALKEELLRLRWMVS